MAVLKCIVGGLLLILIAIAIYVAWQNRASEKIISTFITVSFAGAAATLAATIFSLNHESFEVPIYKTYVFNKITKYPIHDTEKPFISAFSCRELENKTISFVQESIKDDPSLSIIPTNNSDEIMIKRGISLYRDILFRQLLTEICYHYGSNQTTKKTENITGNSITYGTDRPLKIPSKEIKWSEIVKSYPNNSCFSFHEFDFCGLTVPSNARMIFSENKIQIQDKYIDLTIEVQNKGGAIGAIGLTTLLHMPIGESMKYWSETYKILIKAKFNPIRYGHPLMADYKKWAEGIKNGITDLFSTEKHWKETKELFILYNNSPKETPKDMLVSQEDYREWFTGELAKQQKQNDKSLNNNKTK